MEETNKNEKLILFLKIIAIIFIGGFSCLLIGSFAFISIVNAQEVIESDNLIIQKMNGNTLVGNYETSSDVNGYSFYNMSNSISATTSDIKILTKSAINTSGNVAIYTFALYPNDNTENIVRNVQVLGNSCSFETKKISDTTSDHYFVVNVVCPVESVNLGTNWVVSQIKLSGAQLRGVGIGNITFTNTNQDVINELQSISGNVTNLLSRIIAIDNNIYNIINRQDAIVTTIINATSTMTNAINSGFNTTNGKLDEIISNNKVCNIYDKNSIEKKDLFIDINGEETYGQNAAITKYIKITENSKIKPLIPLTSGNSAYCFYNINKELISCNYNRTMTENQYINIPNKSSYFRFTINTTLNKPQLEICDTAQNIQNQQNEEIINSQKETNDTLKDSSTDDPTSDLEDMEENEITNSVISDLLLLPLNMFQRIINSINGTCSTFNLGSLYGSNLTLPCIDIPSVIGSSLWGVIDILFSGIFVLSIRKKFVDIFENITSLKDRGNELE